MAVVFLAAALLSPGSWAQSGCFVDSNGTRACPVGGGGGGGYTRPERDYDREERQAEERERAQRNAEYAAIRKRVDAAYASSDYREALRLLREQLQLRDGPNVREGIAQLEKYFSEQANIEQGNRYNEQAKRAKEKGDGPQALALYQQALALYPNPTAEYRQFVADYRKYVEWETKSNEARAKALADAAERERRHRPEVDRLRTEATTLIDKNPAEALAKLDAALKLLPDDAKTTGTRWLAEASLALNGSNYDAALEAVKKSEGYAPDAAVIAQWNQRIKDERDRQGAGVKSEFGALRQRLASQSGSTDPGAQLKSTAESSNRALQSPVAENAFLTGGRADKQLAGDRFDRIGGKESPLVYPDKKQRQRPLSDLDKQIPGGARDDPQIKQMQAWYWTLNGQKGEKQQKQAELVEQQKTRKDPSLAAKIATLDNDIKRLADDQDKATKTVKERVAVIKKRVLDKGLEWDESPAIEPAAGSAGGGKQGPAPAQLNFIQD